MFQELKTNRTLQNLIAVHGKVDFATLEIGGVDSKDYPDFCDAFIEHIEFADGYSVEDPDILDAIREQNYDKFYEKVLESMR